MATSSLFVPEHLALVAKYLPPLLLRHVMSSGELEAEYPLEQVYEHDPVAVHPVRFASGECKTGVRHALAKQREEER